MKFQRHEEKRIAYTAYTAYRSKFDAWFAGKAAEAGAELLTGVRVTDLIWKDGKVAGVKVGDEELLANVVVGADGFHTVVGRAAGLVEDDPRTFMQGVKEVLDLPSEVIEERFQLREGEGVCFETLGYPVNEIMGATTLYTNKDTVSLAIFGWIDQLKEKGVDLKERLELLKEHPFIDSLIKDARLREYQAHIISNGGNRKFSKLYSDGVMLCGEAGGFMDYAYIGVPPAMLSGIIAADTIEYARKKGDYSAATLGRYISGLEQTGLANLLYNSRRASKYLATSGRKNIPGYIDFAKTMLSDIAEDEVTYLNPEPYAPVREFYLNVVEKRVPGLLRRPIRATIKVMSPLQSRMRKRKVRKEMS